MSVKARIKFLECLAKVNILGVKSWRRLYPQTKRAIISASNDCKILAGGKRCKVKAGEDYTINTPLFAGDVIDVEKEDESLPLSISIRFDFGSETLTVSGADSTDKQCLMYCLVPLPSPYRYSSPIKTRFSLDTSTAGISAYPDCR